MDQYIPEMTKIAAEESQRVAKRFGWNVAPAEDILQTVVERLLFKAVDLDEMENPMGYVRIMARHVAVRTMEKRLDYGRAIVMDFGRNQYEDDYSYDVPEHLLASDANTEAEALGGQDDFMAEAEALLKRHLETLLATRERTVAEAYYLGGRTPAEIADVMGLTHQVVRHTMSALRARLGEEAEGDLRAWRDSQHPEARTPQSEAPEATGLRQLALAGR